MEETTTRSTAYDPGLIEDKWYRFWEDNGLFDVESDSERPPFTIMMPPPNVTGRLHMGHALQSAVQDCLIRLKRMQGFEALWMPGIDHAGIATQNVVSKLLRENEGITRHELGREAFVERVWEWKEEYGGIITDQQKKIGASCDWRRMRFTMDEGFTHAVQTVFVRLFNEGLIYRGDYLVNWCPVDRTAISNEEVDNVERDGHLWYVTYPLADGSGKLTIATTRPETMLGDTAIAVNPEDERYAGIIGKKAILPLLNREIPIIADDYVRIEFGAGALKVTPAHDENDFEIGKRHSLQFVNIMNPDGTINHNGGPYEGLDRFVARDRVVEDLKAAGLLVKVEPYRISIPISNRSKAVIEPLISRQWFVKMQPFADRAIEAGRSGKVVFHPKRWQNEYYRWLEEIRDWTISRQLWWGHRIPVWYYTDEEGLADETRDFVVSVEQPEPGMIQDEDVLDTWFSSWLWPFATLGWPDDTEALKKFYPTDVLVSGYDILFFWISRMIMAGEHFMDEEPYRDVFITGMIKDKLGRWMSKSLGNGIDPLDMIDQYGADAVRFSLILLCAQGQDIKLDPLKFEMGRNFANKIWNAFNVFGRFMEEGKDYRRKRSFEELRLVERWMLHRVNTAIPKVEEALDRYRLNEAIGIIYDVFWHDYCDWYLELIKPKHGEEMDDETIALAVEIYEKLTLMLHPFMPFISEEMWWRLRPRKDLDACIRAAWPTVNTAETDAHADELFSVIQEITTGVRHIRSKQNVPPSKRIQALVNLGEDEHGIETELQRFSPYLERLAGVSDLTIGFGIEKPPASAVDIVGTHEVFVPLAGLIDLDAERGRLQKEIEQKEKFLTGVRRKLQNEQFLSRAPEAVVEKERAKEQDASLEIEKLKANLAELG